MAARAWMLCQGPVPCQARSSLGRGEAAALLPSLKHLSQTESGAQLGKRQAHNSGSVRRTSREAAGAQTIVSRSKRVRLIFWDRRSVQADPIANRRRHNMLRSALTNAPTSRGVGWRARIRALSPLIQSQTPDFRVRKPSPERAGQRSLSDSGMSHAHIPALVKRIS
jgi:hypothetical protein